MTHFSEPSAEERLAGQQVGQPSEAGQPDVGAESATCPEDQVARGAPRYVPKYQWLPSGSSIAKSREP